MTRLKCDAKLSPSGDSRRQRDALLNSAFVYPAFLIIVPDMHGHVFPLYYSIAKVSGDSTDDDEGEYFMCWQRLWVCVEAGVDEDNQDVQLDPTASRASCPLSLLIINKHSRINKTPTPLLASLTTSNNISAARHHRRAHPSIRLITATPSASGFSASSSEASASCARAVEESWDVVGPGPSLPVHGHSTSVIALKTASAAAIEGTSTSSAKTHRKLIPALLQVQATRKGSIRCRVPRQVVRVRSH
ncbi:hypothetical protein CVT25_005331 [Psilocybe cyanescens]|uniref:Uncharacterized protein n=1 Tax=Psilocybe cyanescens TaxID=93625 RepID=A0A409W4A7_PSICY|nr:hypothetical protein CVT25_005331 [Psilocybe cyanescens]